MTDEKKGWQIDFSSTDAENDCQIDAEYTRFLTMGATFSFLGTAFSSFEGFPPLLVIALLMLGMILTVYAFVMKVAVHTAPKEEHL
jgi:F0F1-type ATP synthase assembly protein I